MAIITLLSDWKLKDPYVSLFKGEIMKHIPAVQIFDITHAIEMFMVDQAAFITKVSYDHFPKETIHIILAGSSFSKKSKPIAMKYNDHWFVGEDTGVFQLILDENFPTVIYQYPDDPLTPSTEKIIQMAKWIINGQIEQNGIEIETLKPARVSQPYYNKSEKLIRGEIVYIDSYCNAITNIPNELFQEFYKGDFLATLSSSKHLKITRKHDFYNPNEREVYLLLNRIGFVEITLYQGHIAILGDLKVKDVIEIKFT